MTSPLAGGDKSLLTCRPFEHMTADMVILECRFTDRAALLKANVQRHARDIAPFFRRTLRQPFALRHRLADAHQRGVQSGSVIPRDYITERRKQAPWIHDFQIEQDLVIARAPVEMFSHPVLAERFAFRSGTALCKLHLQPPARYSENVNLVQSIPEPVDPMMGAMQELLDPWLFKP